MTRDFTRWWRSGRHTDLTLRLCDEADRQCRLELRAHKIVLLCSEIAYFEKLLDGLYSEADSGGGDGINIYVNFQLYTPEILLLLLRLVYKEKICADTLDTHEAALLDAHLLEFYQLALCFTFDALAQYCLQRLYQAFSAQAYDAILRYCLVEEFGQQHRYQVQSEKVALYRKLQQWYRYCVPPQQRDAPLAISDADLFAPMQRSIDRGRITAHRSLCHACLFSERCAVWELYAVELGGVRRRDDSLSCSFTVTRERSQTERWSLWVTLTRRPAVCSPDAMSVEHSEEEALRASVQLSLFSQLVSPWLALAPSKELPNGYATEVMPAFQLHAPEHCYDGCCDACGLDAVPVYIFEMIVELENKDCLL